MRATPAGFTLIELLVVITIIGILATLVVVNLGGVDDLAKQKACVAEIAEMQKAVTIYKSIHKKYPSDLQTLYTPDPKFNNQPYLASGAGKDQWDNPYVFEKTKTGVLIKSYGADGVKGGEGAAKDIHSDKLHEFR